MKAAKSSFFVSGAFFMSKDFVETLKEYQPAFGLNLPEAALSRLSDYYHLVQKHNALLHLVAPNEPEEFAVRHILESLMLLEYLPENSKFADVGTGAGLPGIPDRKRTRLNSS